MLNYSKPYSLFHSIRSFSNKKTVFLFVQYEKTIFHHIISAVQPCDFLTAKPRHSRCRANQSLSPHSEKQKGRAFLEPYRHGGQ